MKSENVTDYEMNNQSTDESVQPVSTVQEVDTASINAAEQDATPQSKPRQRPKRKGRAVAGQISRLKLALLSLAPLLVVAVWTEIATILISSGIRASLFDLPGAYDTVNLRGVLQLVLLVPILYAGRQFYQQALQDLQERIPSAEVLLLISTVAAVAGGLFTAVHLVLGQPYGNLPPLFLFYIGACVTAALGSVYLDRWCKAPLPQFLDMPSMWLVSSSILLSIVAFSLPEKQSSLSGRLPCPSLSAAARYCCCRLSAQLPLPQCRKRRRRTSCCGMEPF